MTEEVEVVGYLLEKGRTLSIWPAGSNDQQLMTVSQHQRIVEQIEARNAELVDALQSCLDYGSMTGAEWVEDKARSALQQEATQ